MGKKYKYILKLQDIAKNEIEIDSKEEIEGHTPSLVQTNIMKGVFDSYAEAKKAAEEFKVYKAIITYDHDDGDWIEEVDSVDDFEDPLYFFSYIAAESWAYSEDEEYEDDDGEIHTKHSTYEIVEMDILDIEIVEI